MTESKNVENYSIHKDVISLFQKQNTAGYFHLLYLIQEHRVVQQENQIQVFKQDLENLDQQRISEINEAQDKIREQIKASTKRYEKMLEQNKKELNYHKKQFTEQHELIKTLQAENEIWKNKHDSKKDVNLNKVEVWKKKFDELAKQLGKNNGKN